MTTSGVLILTAVVLVTLLVLWLSYQASELYRARQRATRAVGSVVGDCAGLQNSIDGLRAELTRAAHAWSADQLNARLRAVALEDLKRWGVTNVRWAALRSAGYQSLADLRDIRLEQLERLQGVGPTTAARVVSAAQMAMQSLQAEPAPIPSPGTTQPHALSLIRSAGAWLNAQEVDCGPVTRAANALKTQLSGVESSTGFPAWVAGLFGNGRDAAIKMADDLATQALATRQAPAFRSVQARLAGAEEIARGHQDAALASEHARRASDYSGVMGAALGQSTGRLVSMVSSPPTRPQAGPPPEPVRRGAAAPVSVRTDGGASVRSYAIPTPPNPNPSGHGLTFTVSISSSHEYAIPTGPDDARWYGPGEQAQIAGYTIPGGMLYVGRQMAALSPFRGVDPALVNPDLPVNVQDVDWTAENMPYWPSYSEVPPECRGAYLRWLAHGRRHPSVGIGYVFLFFYGLERRLLHDAVTGNVSNAEREVILSEVAQLLAVYGEQRSFKRYASEFLAVARLQGGSEIDISAPPPDTDPGFEIPLGIRAALGKIVASNLPISPEWALAWVRSHPETRWRTPARRCARELEQLFRLRYRAAFGDGLQVKPNRTKLTGTYKPASASFGGAIGVPLDLPDISALSAPVQKLRDLAYACVDDLEPYSRLLGRDSDARGSLAAMAVLPKELVATGGSPTGERLLEFVRSQLGISATELVSAARLVEHADAREGWSKPTALAMSQWLQRAGYGFEPDVRFGGRPPKPDDQLVLFRLPPEAPSAPSPAYNAAVALLNMAVLVAQADGTVDPDEEARLTTRLQEAMHLEKGERARLGAHLHWQLQTGASFAEVKKRTAKLDMAHREAVAAFLVSVAAADGRLDRKEVEVLTRLFGLLGINEDVLYADLHALGLPERKSAGSTRTARDQFPDAFVLDRARVEAKLAESAAVSALLHDIFSGDEAEVREPVAVPAAPPLAGFDAPHSALVRELVGQATWTRAQLEKQAAHYGLMPEGALDVINERAYDVCGEPAVEGEDPLIVNSSVLKELMA